LFYDYLSLYKRTVSWLAADQANSHISLGPRITDAGRPYKYSVRESEIIMKKLRRILMAVLFAIFSANAIALTVEQLEQGITEALSFSTANSAMAVYVSGYVTGSANYAQSIGLLCLDGKKTSTLELLRQVKAYIESHPEQKVDGAQLLINRSLTGEKC
jgi:hypothetical protein